MNQDPVREALRMALAQLRWREFCECRSPEWDGPPPTPSDTDAALVAALASAPAPQGEPIGEVVISTSPTGEDGWQVVKWSKDAMPIKVGLKLYAAPPAQPSERDALKAAYEAGYDDAVQALAPLPPAPGDKP